MEDFAAVLRLYGVARVVGDRYAGEWVREPFRRHGIAYDLSEAPRSDIYRDTLPLLNSGKVELLDDPRLVAELVALERRTTRSGKDSIDHPPGGHDDVANAVAGALLLTVTAVGRRMVRFAPDAVAKFKSSGRTSLPSPKEDRQLRHHADAPLVIERFYQYFMNPQEMELGRHAGMVDQALDPQGRRRTSRPEILRRRRCPTWIRQDARTKGGQARDSPQGRSGDFDENRANDSWHEKIPKPTGRLDAKERRCRKSARRRPSPHNGRLKI